MKEKLFFYDEYEKFYSMARISKAFRLYCKDAFGEDFSQDGFSDIRQVNRILDIGCGNGKMLKYLQGKTNSFIYGFDYSENAIETAKINCRKAEFKVCTMDEAIYPENMFDLITSMDTMYFVKNMTQFVSRIFEWLKAGGIFFVGYQEGDVIQKTENGDTTVLARAFISNGITYEILDITKETYEMLKRKRKSVEKYKEKFEHEGLLEWYSMIIGQTDCAMVSFEEYKQKNARYIYVARK